MFEKEAERCADEYRMSDDYSSAEPYDIGYANGLEIGFEKGAEFGYNKAMNEVGDRMESAYREGVAFGKDKANEWHYVKDKLPRKSDSTLFELMPVFVAVKVGYNISTYGTYWNLKLGKFECLDEVYAWCYTPEPPEFPKE